MGLTQWTDPTITAGSTPIRKVHIDELRGAINRWRRFYGLGNRSWTDGTITAGSTGVRKVHFDEMRSELNSLRGSAFGWTDGTITASSTPIRKVHMDELRANMNWLEQNYCYTCDSCDYYRCVCDEDWEDGCGRNTACLAYDGIHCGGFTCNCDADFDGCGVDGGCAAYDGMPGCQCENYYCTCNRDDPCGYDFICSSNNTPYTCECESYYCSCDRDDPYCVCDSDWDCSSCDGQCNRVVNCTYS